MSDEETEGLEGPGLAQGCATSSTGAPPFARLWLTLSGGQGRLAALRARSIPAPQQEPDPGGSLPGWFPAEGHKSHTITSKESHLGSLH